MNNNTLDDHLINYLDHLINYLNFNYKKVIHNNASIRDIKIKHLQNGITENKKYSLCNQQKFLIMYRNKSRKESFNNKLSLR